MAMTNSIAFPNMFDVARNKVAILEDEASVVNRTKLLFLTEPTELYNNLNQGVGLRQHLWKYNNDNVVAMIKDKIIEQLRLHEPCVLPDQTQFSDSLISEEPEPVEHFNDANRLKMTVGLQTTFGNIAEVSINGSE